MSAKQLFHLQYEDRRKVLMLSAVFFLAGTSEMVNYTSFMALFNSRVGSAYMPYMYLLEAFLLPLEGWLLSLLPTKIKKQKLMVLLYGLFLAIGLLNAAALLTIKIFSLDVFYFYFLLFLSSNFVIRQQTLLMWSTAFDSCSTQQAKRMMPFFVTAAIIGGIAAGILSRTLATALGSEFLYLLAALLLLAGIVPFRKAVKRYISPLTAYTDSKESGIREHGYWKMTLRSPFLLAVIGLMTLMPAIYFLIEYQYLTVSEAYFASEEQLTSFYGLMVILLFVAALMLQLLAARLLDRLGAGYTMLLISVVFAIALIFVSTQIETDRALQAVSIGYGLLYLLLYYFAEPGFQLFFKMLPEQQRDGVRYVAQSIAASLGILLGSALAALHSTKLLPLSGQAILGAVCAIVLTVLALFARRLYVSVLLQRIADRDAGSSNLLHQLAESLKEERVRAAVLKQLKQKQPALRRYALEMLSQQPHPDTAAALLNHAEQYEGEERRLALAAMHDAGWRSLVAEQRAAFFADDDERVRLVAYRGCFRNMPQQAISSDYIGKALADGSLPVRLAAMEVMPCGEELLERVRKLLISSTVEIEAACEIVAMRKLKELSIDMLLLAAIGAPTVKQAAVRALGALGGEGLVANLMEMLPASGRELRTAVQDALIAAGPGILPELRRFLSMPQYELWCTAVKAAVELDEDGAVLREAARSCEQHIRQLTSGRVAVHNINKVDQGVWSKLAQLRLQELSKQVLDTVWLVIERLYGGTSLGQLRQALESGDEQLIGHGLEVLSEGLGDPRLSKTLLTYYKKESDGDVASKGGDKVDDQVDTETKDNTFDAWLQALTVKAGAVEGEGLLMAHWDYLNALDKISQLSQTALFQSLALEELGRLASISRESTISEGSTVMRRGEICTELTIVVEGHIELSGLTASGAEGTIKVLGAADTLGEESMFDEQPSIFTAEAILGEARLLHIAISELGTLMRLYPDIGVGLVRAMSRRIRTMEQLFIQWQ